MPSPPDALRPPHSRRFAVALALLLVLHAAVLGGLWVNGAGPDRPTPAVVGTDADAGRLLAAAVHNHAVLAHATDVRLVDPADGATVATIHAAVDPAAARMRVAGTQHDGSYPLVAEGAYLTGWGHWLRRGGEWRYRSFHEDHYDARNARLLQPPIAGADGVEKTVHGNGTVTVTLRRVPDSLGVLSFAGTNATLRYRIAFAGDRPYVASAVGRPAGADGGDRVTVHTDPGGDVDRPAAVPPLTIAEVIDRLVAGARYA